MAKIIWEDIKSEYAGHLQRAPVPGGWLVRDVQDVLVDMGRGPESGYAWSSSLTFVPDPTGQWRHL